MNIRISAEPIDGNALKRELADPHCGGFVAFEGWVRNHHEGRAVERLEYEAYAPLALREGELVVAEAKAQFDIRQALCVHRTGLLELSDMAVWVGVAAAHRDAAFGACRYIIDEVKLRLPIWKKEYYRDGSQAWVNCAHCVRAGPSAAQG